MTVVFGPVDGSVQAVEFHILAKLNKFGNLSRLKVLTKRSKHLGLI